MNTNQKIILIVVVVAVVFAGLVGSGAFLFYRYEKAKQAKYEEEKKAKEEEKKAKEEEKKAKEKEECMKHLKKIYVLRKTYLAREISVPTIEELEVELGEVSSCRITRDYYKGPFGSLHCELHHNDMYLKMGE